MDTRKINRIDCVGNANNAVLLIARALRRLGYDAHLHLTMGTERDHPEVLYPEYANGYPEWIHDWRVNKKHIYLSQDIVHRHRLCFALRNTDALILNYDNVALGSLLDKPTVCALTGTDLYNFANSEDLRLKHKFGNPFEDKKRIIHMLMQRAAIRNACGVIFAPKGALLEGDKILHSIGIQDCRRITVPGVDTENLIYSPQPKRKEMIILYSARLSWDIGKGDVTELDNKGTDIFIRAFARFIHSGGRARLILFKVGARVAETEALVAALGIEAWIEWREHMPQAEFNDLMKKADIVVDQIGGKHADMAMLTAMALGRPLLATAPNYLLWKMEENFPLCNVKKEEDVCEWLWDLSNNIQLRENIGKRSRKFIEKYFSVAVLAQNILSALCHNEQIYEENWLWKMYDRAVWAEFQHLHN